MTMNPSRRPLEVFVLIILQMILILCFHVSDCQWEQVVCSPRRVLRRLGGVRIFVLIITQVIRIHFGKWKVVVCSLGRKVNILQCSMHPWKCLRTLGMNEVYCIISYSLCASVSIVDSVCKKYRICESSRIESLR